MVAGIVPLLAERREILIHGAAAVSCPIEADARRVGAMIVNRGPVRAARIGVLRHRRVVIAANQVVQAERHGVVDEGLARVEHHRADRRDEIRRLTPRHADPLVGDRLGGQPRIPR